MIRIWRLDDANKIDLYSYGVFNFPRQSGYSIVKCETWTPIGGFKSSALSIYLGNQPRLSSNALVLDGTRNRRANICSESNGTVILEIETILRNFKKLGITC